LQDSFGRRIFFVEKKERKRWKFAVSFVILR
jgi:hypothetical protein